MKKFFASRFSKKYLAVALVAFLALAFFAVSSEVVFAATAGATPTQAPNLLSCAASGNFATCLVYFTTYVVSNIVSLFVSLGAWLIQLGLQFDANIYNSPMVQAGFGVCLSIANLGFVLGIIIIAIATIFKIESYGYKKALWRLIVMAILVNFGLVVTAPIVNFADGMTNYFIAQSGNAAGISGFVNSFVNTFNPAALGNAPAPNAAAMCSSVGNAAFWIVPSGAINTVCNAITGQQGNQSTADSFSQALLSLVFTIVFQLTIVLTFFTLAVLLIIRFVALGVLLIILPFAWLSWIFPGTSGHFKKWWSEFIKWSFFPPAALFFVWLALSINKGAYLTTVGSTGAVSGSNSPVASIAQVIGQIIPLNQFAEDIILMGIMIGGLMMASSLTGKFGAVVVEQAKNVSGAIQGYVGKQTKKGARLAYQKSGAPALANRLREGRFGGLEKVPVVGWMARRGGSLVGRGMAGVSTNSKMVEDSKKNVPKDHKDIEKDLAGGGLSTQEKFAWLAEYAKQGKLTENTKIGNQKAHEFFDENEFLFARYGQGKLRADGDKHFMSNQAYRDARKKGDTATMQTAMDRFLVDFTKQDSARVNSNALFNENADQNDVNVRLHALAQRPELVPGIYKKLNGKNQQYFEEKYGVILDQELEGYDAQLTADQSRAADPLKRQLENSKTQRDQLNAQIQTLKDKNETLKRSRTLAVGRDQESIDQDIAANEDTAKKLQDQIVASNDADKSLNDQLGQISKRFIENTPARIARLKKAKTAFERLFINNATEGPSEEKEEKKEDSKKDGDKKDGSGH